MLSLLNRNKTFKPRRRADGADNPRYELAKLATDILATSLPAGDLREAVKLPEGYAPNDWIAVHLVDLFNQLNLIYGSMCDDCTDGSCPIMSAGGKYEYLWADAERYKSPTRVSAPKYVDLLMDWVDKQLADEALFPVAGGRAFPEDFRSDVKRIMRRLFRVYAHLFHSHLDEIVAVGAEAHLSTCFRHFVFFGTEFGLLPSKEMEPLKEIIAKL